MMSNKFMVDDEALEADDGMTIAGALISSGRRAWRLDQHGKPRGVFCGIGVCFDCVLTVEGLGAVRACITPCEEGMRISTEADPP